MIVLSDKWARTLMTQGETGMGYQIASVVLNDGRHFKQVVIVEGTITQIKDIEDIPFSEDQIDQIIVTHDMWDFNAERKAY
jgi:hypothetical protein